jgi:glutathione synthase/RimK-type ligase-like ATP-grasp enzyme
MILGVYFNNRNFKRLLNGRLDFKMSSLAKSAAKEGMQILVFSPLCLDWHSERINGLTYNIENSKWESIECTFPNIIYDRATFTDNEKEIGNFVRQRLSKDYKISFVNSKSYFNKWETHKVLSKNSDIIGYLPDTARYVHPFQIVDFLNKYASVYMKDSAGRLGRNIFKLQKIENNLYTLNYQIDGLTHSDKLTLEEIHSFLIDNKFVEKNIIIQQGIEIAKIDNHPFDVRILAQKKDIDTWEVVDKSLRVASPGSIVTNVSSGGEVRKFNAVIPFLFSDSSLISKDIDILTINVCKELEKNYGKLGELGIDIALDKTGKIWLIEVNGKPAKLCVFHSGDLELIDKACRNVIIYSKQLNTLRNETGSA